MYGVGNGHTREFAIDGCNDLFGEGLAWLTVLPDAANLKYVLTRHQTQSQLLLSRNPVLILVARYCLLQPTLRDEIGPQLNLLKSRCDHSRFLGRRFCTSTSIESS
jgi:hypothetical protein